MIPDDGRLSLNQGTLMDSPRSHEATGGGLGLNPIEHTQAADVATTSITAAQFDLPTVPPSFVQQEQMSDPSLVPPLLPLPSSSSGGANSSVTTAPSSPSFPPLPALTPSPSSLLSVSSSVSSIPKFTPPPNFVQSPKPAVLRVGLKERPSLHLQQQQQQQHAITTANTTTTSHPSVPHRHHLVSSSPRLMSPHLMTSSPRLTSSSSPRASPSTLYASSMNPHLSRSDIGSPQKSSSSRLARQSSLVSSHHPSISGAGSSDGSGSSTTRIQRSNSRRLPSSAVSGNPDSRRLPQFSSSNLDGRRQQLLPNPAHSPPVFISPSAFSSSQWQQHIHQQYYSQQQQQQQQQQQSQGNQSSRPSHRASSSTSSRATTTTQPSPPHPISLTTSPRSPAGHSLSPRTPQSTMLSPASLPPMSILAPHPHPHPSHRHHHHHHHQHHASSSTSSIAILSPPPVQSVPILSPKSLPHVSILSPKSLPVGSISEETNRHEGAEDDVEAVPVLPPHRSESPGWQVVGSSQSWTSPRLKSASSSSSSMMLNPSLAVVASPMTSSMGIGSTTMTTLTEYTNPSLTSLVKSPPFTPFTSVHLQIDELPTEGDSDEEDEQQRRQEEGGDIDDLSATTTTAVAVARGGPSRRSTATTIIQASHAEESQQTMEAENTRTPSSEQARAQAALPTPSPRIDRNLGSDITSNKLASSTTSAIKSATTTQRPPPSTVQVPITPVSNVGESDAVVVGGSGGGVAGEGSGSGSGGVLVLGLDEPPTPPVTVSDVPLQPDVIEEALEKAIMPWSRKEREERFGVLPMRKIVKRVERGQWEDAMKVEDVPRESALWRLVRAQRLWIQGNAELFKLKHPSGLPRDHKSPKTQFVDDGEPLKAIEILAQSILLDPRIVAFKSPEARRDFTEQIAWQIFADARHVGWPELANDELHLDDVFAKADARSHATGLYGGAINTRRALASFIRNHIVVAILEEQDGFTQKAILKYGRALDTIDWVNQALGPAPDKILYGKGDAKQRVEVVYDGVFGRAVQIRLGHTLVAQYNFIKREKRYSALRNDLLAEILQGSLNLFESIGSLVMNPHVQKDLTIEVYVSDFVYRFYGRESAKIILNLGQASPRGGRPATDIARERSASSAQAFIQAALLFPEDEEERIQCFEMALEEMLKVGGLRVGEVLAMYDSLKEARMVTDKVWNHRTLDDDDEVDETELGLFDDDATAAAKKKKKKKKKKKEAAVSAIAASGTLEGDAPVAGVSSEIGGEKVAPSIPSPVVALPRDTATPKTPASALLQTRQQTAALLPFVSARAALIEGWFNTLQKSQIEKRIMNGDVLHPALTLRGKPEVVWSDVTDDEGDLEEAEGDGASVPWASWGMRSVKTTKWGDLVKGDGEARPSSGTKKKPPSNKANENPPKKVKISTDPSSSITSSSALPLALPSAPSGLPAMVAGPSTSRLTQTPKTLPMPLGSSPEKIKSAIKAIRDSPARILATLAPEGSPKKTLAGRKIPMEIYELLKSPDLKPLEDALKEAEAEVQAQGGGSPSKEDQEITLKPAASHLDRPTPWSIVQRLTKQKLFAFDLDAFNAAKRK
ncbi:hypothetical protein FRC17_005548 [Serendipita sp. 399]|nr:hypothetical protein FRC17_005548 [Serendipita sp. 399]